MNAFQCGTSKKYINYLGNKERFRDVENSHWQIFFTNVLCDWDLARPKVGTKNSAQVFRGRGREAMAITSPLLPTWYTFAGSRVGAKS